MKQILYGLLTYLPFVKTCHKTGGTDSARYCYSVWMRHLIKAREVGFDPVGKIVAELGPGDSIGVGLAALISGCEKYYALDAVQYANKAANRKIFEELVELFKNKTPIPDESEFPKIKPILDSYNYPDGLDIDFSRIEQIRKAITSQNGMITYRAPWDNRRVIERNSVDMIMSQAALEHVSGLDRAYSAMALWLKPGGYMSHTIDFKSHGLAETWDGHRMYSDIAWRLVQGRRPYLLNREPLSTHRRLISENGLTLRSISHTYMVPQIKNHRLPTRFSDMTDEDRCTSDAFLQACRTTEV
jgi:hypothetical protein